MLRVAQWLGERFRGLRKLELLYLLSYFATKKPLPFVYPHNGLLHINHPLIFF